MDLSSPIENLPKTAPRTIRFLRSFDIVNFWDLLNFFPYRYVDYRNTVSIADLLTINDRLSGSLDVTKVTIAGNILSTRNRLSRRGMTLQTVRINDHSGVCDLVWFNQPYLMTIFKPGLKLQVSGALKVDSGVPLVPEEYEIIKNGEESIHTGRIVPYYSTTAGIASRTIREKIHWLTKMIDIAELEDSLPTIIEKKYRLSSASSAYLGIHFPRDDQALSESRKRLAFAELFSIQLSSRLIRQKWSTEKVSITLSIKPFSQNINQFIKTLPFELTQSQKKVIDEILTDLEKKTPMNRLLQGDVGSGKTVVAAIASFATYLNGAKTLVMAPTEILAIQHSRTFDKVFKKSVKSGKFPRVCLITSSHKLSQKEINSADIIIGTHALLTKKTDFDNVALVIIDEQHKFGVAQRARLREKGYSPHLLSMTATPIPRTISLTLYGELDVSIIDTLPKGRLTIKTFLVPPQKRAASQVWIKERVKKEKDQVFIVCPFVEESTSETLQTVKAAKKEYEKIKNIFTDCSVGLVHGKMKIDEKKQLMDQFSLGKIDILVSTPIVEVGIDVKGANVIVIEAAERFGLAQLHQLRGRVGRGEKQAFCLLFSDTENVFAMNRLRTFCRLTSGLALAEYDLKHRGPGEIYGLKQHGLSDLKIASLNDITLFTQTNNAVDYFMSNFSVSDFPQLEKNVTNYQYLRVSRD